MSEIGRHLLRSSGLIPLEVAHDCVQMALKYLKDGCL